MSKAKSPSKPQGFDAYILLSEPLQFSTTEIEEALFEDYPDLDLQAGTGFSMPQNCDTADFITAPILLGAGGADGGIASLIRLPGAGIWDPVQLTPSQRLPFIDVDLVLPSNASYICVTVGGKDEDETSQFRAARLCSCLTALFAKLPIALAVYWDSADHFLRPEDAVAMADRAMKDEYPIEQWVGMRLVRPEDTPDGPVIGVTKGLNRFKGVELAYANAPVDLNTVAATLMTTSAMLTGYGHKFTDGDTIGSEGEAPEDAIRIRFAPKAKLGAADDYWLMVPPESAVDHVKLLGKIRRRAGPKNEKVQVRSRMNFFKWIMRGSKAS